MHFFPCVYYIFHPFVSCTHNQPHSAHFIMHFVRIASHNKVLILLQPLYSHSHFYDPPPRAILQFMPYALSPRDTQPFSNPHTYHHIYPLDTATHLHDDGITPYISILFYLTYTARL